MADQEPQELTLDIAIQNIGEFFTRLGREGKVESIAPFEFDALRICWNMVANTATPEPEVMDDSDLEHKKLSLAADGSDA